jgi:hypothetical protein
VARMSLGHRRTILYAIYINHLCRTIHGIVIALYMVMMRSTTKGESLYCTQLE